MPWPVDFMEVQNAVSVDPGFTAVATSVSAVSVDEIDYKNKLRTSVQLEMIGPGEKSMPFMKDILCRLSNPCQQVLESYCRGAFHSKGVSIAGETYSVCWNGQEWWLSAGVSVKINEPLLFPASRTPVLLNFWKSVEEVTKCIPGCFEKWEGERFVGYLGCTSRSTFFTYCSDACGVKFSRSASGLVHVWWYVPFALHGFLGGVKSLVSDVMLSQSRDSMRAGTMMKSSIEHEIAR